MMQWQQTKFSKREITTKKMVARTDLFATSQIQRTLDPITATEISFTARIAAPLGRVGVRSRAEQGSGTLGD